MNSIKFEVDKELGGLGVSKIKLFTSQCSTHPTQQLSELLGVCLHMVSMILSSLEMLLECHDRKRWILLCLIRAEISYT